MARGEGGAPQGAPTSSAREAQDRAEARRHPVGAFTDVLLGEASWPTRLRVRRHLRRCATCRAAWAETVAAVDAWTAERAAAMPTDVSAEAARLAVRARLLARVEAGSGRRRGWQRVEFAAGILLGAAVVAGVVRAVGPRGPGSRTLVAEPPTVAGWKPAEVAALRSPGAAHGVVWLDTGAGRATVQVWHMPALPRGDLYEVWWVTPQGHLAAGTFGVDRRGDGVATLRLPPALAKVRAVGITREPAPGTRAPTTARVVGGIMHVPKQGGDSRGATARQGVAPAAKVGDRYP